MDPTVSAFDANPSFHPKHHEPDETVARMESDGSSEIKQIEQSSSNKTDSSAKETEIAARKGGRTRPPLSFLSILNDANIEIDMSCPHKLCDLLYAGVYIKPNTLKYFVDKKSNKNCFAVFPREFYICWGENPKYWKWTKEKEPSGEDIEVAELLDVCWLEVRGKIDTIDLSPGALHEIVFVLKVYESPNDDTENTAGNEGFSGVYKTPL